MRVQAAPRSGAAAAAWGAARAEPWGGVTLITPDFRMPRLHEAAEQFAVVREAALARSAAFEAAKADAYSALASFLPSQDKFAQLTASLETPWVSTAQALSSFASVARLASIGNAIHSAPFGA